MYGKLGGSWTPSGTQEITPLKQHAKYVSKFSFKFSHPAFNKTQLWIKQLYAKVQEEGYIFHSPTELHHKSSSIKIANHANI